MRSVYLVYDNDDDELVIQDNQQIEILCKRSWERYMLVFIMVYYFSNILNYEKIKV